MMTATQRTPLYGKHVALGGKMVEFAGWQMPIQYKGVIAEHKAVRDAVGIFDVSHMGRVVVEGGEAEQFVDYLSTNLIVGKKDGIAIYTVFANEKGGAVDDAIIYRYSATHFVIVVNAGNREKDLKHFQQVAAGFDVTLTPKYEEEGILAVQGPKAKDVVGMLFPEAVAMRPMRFSEYQLDGYTVAVARTGYTGSDGYELSGEHAAVVKLWDLFLEKGEGYGIVPCGLGARDTLRLEAGFALYGHELSETIAATESVSAWTVKAKKHDFLGKAAMVATGSKRSQYGVVLQGRGIAREGYEVWKDEKCIGVVTSGTQAPTLGKAIAIVMVEGSLQEGDNIQVKIRDKRIEAEVVKLPFYTR